MIAQEKLKEYLSGNAFNHIKNYLSDGASTSSQNLKIFGTQPYHE